MFNDTSSGIDRSELDAKRRKNLAQAAPIDSSNCSKSRMSIGREFMRLMRENEWQKSARNSSQSPFILPIVRVYHCSALLMRERKQFPPQDFLCHAWDYQARTQFLKFSQMVKGINIDHSREGSFPNHGYKAWVKFIGR